MDHLFGVEYFIQYNLRDHFDVALKLVFCDNGLLFCSDNWWQKVYFFTCLWSKGKTQRTTGEQKKNKKW